MAVHMITTVDNPYNPFTEFKQWLAFDTLRGYNSLGIVARVYRGSDELSEADQEEAREAAIDEVVQNNVLGLWTKAVKPTTE